MKISSVKRYIPFCVPLIKKNGLVRESFRKSTCKPGHTQSKGKKKWLTIRKGSENIFVCLELEISCWSKTNLSKIHTNSAVETFLSKDFNLKWFQVGIAPGNTETREILSGRKSNLDQVNIYSWCPSITLCIPFSEILTFEKACLYKSRK